MFFSILYTKGKGEGGGLKLYIWLVRSVRYIYYRLRICIHTFLLHVHSLRGSVGGRSG